MPRVPRPDEMPRAALEPANQPAQINMRVAESIGQSGRQMGNAIAAIGSAFGEVAGKIGQANDATNYDNAKLEWLKGDQTIQDDTRSNAGEDGAQWQSVPQRYADLNKSIDERFPIGNPAQKRQLDFWREQNTFNRGIGAAREYQGAQRNQFLKGFDQDVSGLEQRIADGQVDPTMFGQHYDALSGKLGSMNRTVISQSEAEAKTRELQSRLVGATDRYLATKDPAERDRFWGQVRGGRFEIDQNTQGGQGNVEIKKDGAYSVIRSSAGANLRVSSQYADRFAGLVGDLEAAGIKADPNQSGGYNYRNIRGTNTLSKHATGEAIDLNWDQNPRGGPGAIRKQLGEEQIRTIAAKWGMKWGGDWKNPDDMHFEVDRGAQPKATFQQVKAQSSSPSNTIKGDVTAYAPKAGGDRVEGGYAASKPGPDGKAEVRTLEDFVSGQSKYITIAGNPKLSGREYTIPKIEFVGKDGKTQTLENVPAVVHDTGSAFKNAPEGRFDVPVARDADPKTMSANHALWKKSGIEFIPGGASQKGTQVADAGGTVAPANDNAGQPSAGGEAPDPGAERADPNEPPTAQAASDVQAPGASVAGTQKPTEFGNTQIPMGRLAPGQVFTVKTPQGEMKIPSEWINALPQRAREQMSRQAGEQYKLYERQLKATADEMIRNQEISVANTGKNAVDYDPATVKLAYQKDPKKLIEHARRVRIASEMHSELADAVSLPDDEIVARVERLRPQEGTPDFAERQAVFDGAEKRVLALMKQRETDPGKAVEGAKEVQSVRSKLVGGVPRNKLDSLALMDARMAAQRNIDIPEHLRSPITGDEARALAAPLRGLNPGDALESIQKLHDKVKGQYGEKYSGLIIDRVIATTIREKQKREAFAGAMRELDEEGKISPTSVERMRNLEELGRRERELAPTRVVKPPAPGIMSRLYDMLPSKEAVGKAIRGDHDYNADNALNGTGPDRPAEPVKVYPTPNADHIARLKKFPQSIDQFDQVFGDGAAEKAVPGVRRMLKLQGVQ